MNYRKIFGSCGVYLIYDRVHVISDQNLAKHDLRCPRLCDNTATQNIFFAKNSIAHAANAHALTCNGFGRLDFRDNALDQRHVIVAVFRPGAALYVYDL